MGPARWSCIYFVAVVIPFPVLTQLLFTHYPNGVISKISLYSPRSIGDFKGLVCMPVGGRLQILEGSVCICRHKRWVSDSDTVRWVRHTVWWVSGTNDEKGGVGQVKDGWVGGGVCTHNKRDWSKRWKAPTSQMSLCQIQPGTAEGVIQWWCYQRTWATGTKKGGLV